jgi:hypothetical protein
MQAWLAVVPFSAYVYYAQRAGLDALEATQRRERLLVEPLVHRLSKRDDRIACAHGDPPDFDALIGSAVAEVERRFARDVGSPRQSRQTGFALIDLARLVARATAEHLARPDDGNATALFETLRTRIRFAQDVLSGERHLRDRNPLP